jgi:hypothetical protein
MSLSFQPKFQPFRENMGVAEERKKGPPVDLSGIQDATGKIQDHRHKVRQVGVSIAITYAIVFMVLPAIVSFYHKSRS